MSHRKIEYLNDNRIIYRRGPVNDDPTYSTEHFDYYEDGTHEHYHRIANVVTVKMPN